MELSTKIHPSRTHRAVEEWLESDEITSETNSILSTRMTMDKPKSKKSSDGKSRQSGEAKSPSAVVATTSRGGLRNESNLEEEFDLETMLQETTELIANESQTDSNAFLSNHSTQSNGYQRVPTSTNSHHLFHDEHGNEIFPEGPMTDSSSSSSSYCSYCFRCKGRWFDRHNSYFTRHVWIQSRVLILFLCGLFIGMDLCLLGAECIVIGISVVGIPSPTVFTNTSIALALVWMLGLIAHLGSIQTLCSSGDGCFIAAYTSVSEAVCWIEMAVVVVIQYQWSLNDDGAPSIWYPLAIWRTLVCSTTLVAVNLALFIVNCVHKPTIPNKPIRTVAGCRTVWSGGIFAVELTIALLEFNLVYHSDPAYEPEGCAILQKLAIVDGTLGLVLALWTIAFRSRGRSVQQEYAVMNAFVCVYTLQLIAFLLVTLMPFMTNDVSVSALDDCTESQQDIAAYLRIVLVAAKLFATVSIACSRAVIVLLLSR